MSSFRHDFLSEIMISSFLLRYKLILNVLTHKLKTINLCMKITQFLINEIQGLL